MIKQDIRETVRGERINQAYRVEELEDFIVMLEKRRIQDVGFWQAEYEAGPLAGDDEVKRTIDQFEQSYDEAIAVVKKQLAAIE